VKLVMALENVGYVTELAKSGTCLSPTIGVLLVRAQEDVIHAKVKVGILVKNVEVQGL